MSYATFSKSQWFKDQFDEEKYSLRLLHPSRFVDATLEDRLDIASSGPSNFAGTEEIGYSGGELKCLMLDLIAGGTPLRSRMAYAINQFVIASLFGSNLPGHIVAGFWDKLKINTGGTITSLLQDISLDISMAVYLTFWGKTKADPETGVEPDENYARELLQLFSVGIQELNEDGTPKLDGEGQEIEIYGPEDISQLARVFTGFVKPGQIQNHYDTLSSHITSVGMSTHIWTDTGSGGGNLIDVMEPLHCIPDWHEWGAKNFLGISIPAVEGSENQTVEAAQAEVRYAVAEICKHPNVIPFWARRLIQFMVKENPSSAYVEYVTAAGRAGLFVLPDETVVGSGEPGDLQAMAAAILFHTEAHVIDWEDDNAGRIASMFELYIATIRWHSTKEIVYPPSTEFTTLRDLWHKQDGLPAEVILIAGQDAPELVSRAPFHQPSVFGFGRPGFVAVGTPAGDEELTTPGLQDFNWSNYQSFFSGIWNPYNGSAPHDAAGFGASCMRGDELMAGVPALNAELVDDSDDFVDMLAVRAFGGRLSAPTIAIMKQHAAWRVGQNNQASYNIGTSDDPEDGHQFGGCGGVYGYGAMSVEWAVRR